MRIVSLILGILLLLAPAASAATRRHIASFDPCSVAVSPAAISIPAAGGEASVQVTVTGPANCSWAPVSAAAWIGVSPMLRSVTISAGPNTTGVARTGLVHVRSGVIVVTQPSELPNLLTNGSFTNDVTGWSNTYSTGPGSAVWAMDTPSLLNAPPVNRGTAAITSNQATTGYQLNQCAAVSPKTTYDAGASIFIPSGQAHGVAVFALYSYDNPTCQGNYLGSKPVNRDTPTGTWFDETMSITTDSRTRGMLVVIGAGGTATPPFSAYFDSVFVRPRP